jgi:hypothetical protein
MDTKWISDMQTNGIAQNSVLLKYMENNKNVDFPYTSKVWNFNNSVCSRIHAYFPYIYRILSLFIFFFTEYMNKAEKGCYPNITENRTVILFCIFLISINIQRAT